MYLRIRCGQSLSMEVAPEFPVTREGGGTGPFDLAPNGIQAVRVQYCPAGQGADEEAVVIHCSEAVVYVRAHGQGVPYIAPVWDVDLTI